MRRTIFKQILLFTAFTFLLNYIGRSQYTSKPNIIIILADDLGWGDVGYHGSDIQTPNIDDLAKEGIILNRFYTAAVCSPDRAGLLTGRYPDRFGLRTVIPPWSEFGVDTTEVFLPQALANAGYKNRAIVGKWHLGHAYLRYQPLNRGFTHFYGLLNGNIDYFTHQREGQLDWHNDDRSCYDSGYSTDLLADEAIRDIKSYDKDKSPFFLYLAFNAPHSPLQAEKKYLLEYGYDSASPPFATNGNFDVKGRGNTKRQTYAAMVTNMDENIGRVLKTLKDLHIENNTLILFMSDNGASLQEGASSGNLRGGKGTEWEGGVRAPAIVRWPAKFNGGTVSNQLMGYVDVMPTLLAVAGIQSKPKKPFDGINMLPVLSGLVPGINRYMYLGFGAIANQDWKLIEAAKEPRKMKLNGDLLFHISVDSLEKNNVRDEYRQQYEDLKKALLNYAYIKSKSVAPSFNAGQRRFVAPKDWIIKDY